MAVVRNVGVVCQFQVFEVREARVSPDGASVRETRWVKTTSHE